MIRSQSDAGERALLPILVPARHMNLIPPLEISGTDRVLAHKRRTPDEKRFKACFEALHRRWRCGLNSCNIAISSTLAQYLDVPVQDNELISDKLSWNERMLGACQYCAALRSAARFRASNDLNRYDI